MFLATFTSQVNLAREQNRNGPMSDEFLDIVDNDDRVIGQESRATAHQFGLQHRGVHVFLFTEQGKLLVQKRSADRVHSPSRLDCSVSEHVKAGESYLEAATRGMKEELGVEGITLEPLVKFRMEYGINDNEISTLYRGSLNPVHVIFDPLEIAEISYYSVDELRKMMDSNGHIFCGWFIEILNWYLGKPAKMSLLRQVSR
jgi:isopentenyl-diphosphate delta-isomerase